MDTLRIILIILGVAVIVGIYLWEKFHKDDLPDRFTSIDTDHEEASGLVITTQTKFNEDDLKSELADLNFFMGNSTTDDSSDDEIINEFNIHASADRELHGDSNEPPVVEDLIETGHEAATDDIAGQSKEAPVTGHIVVLHIVAKDQNAITGQALNETVNGAGFEFGDMNIYHYRDIDLSGELQTLFSLVNMFEPGYFDPEKLDEFSTRGVSIFATLKNDGSDLHVFETMLDTTRQISAQLGGEVWGPDKSPLTEETLDNIVQKLREAE